MASAPQHVVLLVEDNEEISENLAEILAEKGYLCWRAANADWALRLLEAESRAPDAVLIDLKMPGMTVAQFVSTLRQRPAWSRIPIVLITAALGADIPEDLDVDEVVFKPFRLEAFLELVADVVAQGSSARAGGG